VFVDGIFLGLEEGEVLLVYSPYPFLYQLQDMSYKHESSFVIYNLSSYTLGRPVEKSTDHTSSCLGFE
jgi:hypothetical protein